MTSPPSLIYMPPGLIWDGVSEYIDGVADPEVGPTPTLLRMIADKTRRFSEWRADARPMTSLRYVTEQLGWETVGITYDNAQSFVYYDGYDTAFLGYDGTLHREPVNQFYELNRFRAHAARFAHQLDVSMGGYKMESAEKPDSLVIHQTISAMIGVAGMKYKEWAAVDPEELIVGGNYDGTLLWKRYLDDYRGVDAKLCGQCNVSELPRQFLRNADLSAFRRLYRQGIIYGYDSNTTPWSPLLFDVATSPEADYYEQLESEYDELLYYYSTDVGAHDIAVS